MSASNYAFGLNPLSPLLMRNRVTGRAMMQLTGFGPGADTDVIDDARVRWSTCPLPIRAGYAVGTFADDVRPLLALVPVPVTAVVGSLDRLCPPSRAQMIVDHVPDGRVHVLDGAGHMMTWERTDEVAQILLDAAA